jgi:alpha-acetolactate decarboxylase
MDGVASNGLPISSLLSHGDHGLGTFRHMIGEMIILHGAVYQMKSDGTVDRVDVSTSSSTPSGDVPVTPFAMITRFRPTTVASASFSDKTALFTLLTSILPRTHNVYLAFRLRGSFRSLTVRTVGGQAHPGEKLSALGSRQVSHTFENISGSVVGFRTPAFLQGVSVAGDHLHFISEDHSRGGHLLAFETDGEVQVEAAPMTRLVLELPMDDDEFDQAKLEKDETGIRAVEG